MVGRGVTRSDGVRGLDVFLCRRTLFTFSLFRQMSLFTPSILLVLTAIHASNGRNRVALKKLEFRPDALK